MPSKIIRSSQANMNNIITSLLLVNRQSVHTSKSRVSSTVQKKEYSILPTIKAIKRFRSGTILGKLGRHIFEHKMVNRILGSQLALATIATSLIQPAHTNLAAANFEPVSIKAERIELVTSKGVQYPLEMIKINQGYFFYHPGIDFDGEIGDPIKPVMPGVVIAAGYSRLGYGNSVEIEHSNGITSLYAHLSKIEVQAGDQVTMNTKIGLVGSTGRSTGSHLHLEIRDNGRAINPLSILPRQ